LFDFEKWRLSFAEKQVKTIVLEVTPQKRSAKVSRQLFGQGKIWAIILCTPKHLLVPTPLVVFALRRQINKQKVCENN